MTDEQQKRIDADVLAAIKRLGKGGRWTNIARIYHSFPDDKTIEVADSICRMQRAGTLIREDRNNGLYYKLAPAGGNKN